MHCLGCLDRSLVSLVFLTSPALIWLIHFQVSLVPLLTPAPVACFANGCHWSG